MGLLVQLSQDEVALVSAYRVCSPENRQDIRCIAHAAAADGGSVVALLSPRPVVLSS